MRFGRIVRFLKVALPLLVLCLFAAPKVAYTLPSSESDRWYYTDDTFTETVGEIFHGCDGSRYSWGDRTPYVRATGASCQSYGGCTSWKICPGGDPPGTDCVVTYQSCW